MYSQYELEQFWNSCCKDSQDNFNDLKQISFTPFIGAGMSVPFGYKTWVGFLKEVIAMIPDAQQKKTYFGMLKKREFLRLASDINEYFNNGIIEVVRKKFKTTIMQYPKDNYVKLFQDMGVKEFLTTNYDEVIEKNLDIDNLQIYLPSSNSTIKDICETNRRGVPYLIKLHGSYNKADSIILTEEQYQQNYQNEGAKLPEILSFLWSNKVFLFLGCGLEKDYLIDRIVHMAKNTSSIWHYAILEMPSSHKKCEEKEIELMRMKIRPIWYPKGKHCAVYTILHMLSKKSPKTDEKSMKKIQEREEYIQNFECYVDAIAKQSFDRTIQYKICKAILAQAIEEKDITLEELSSKVVSSSRKCVLKIEGDPGTGKSTLSSLIYLEISKKYMEVYPALIDLHYYDDKIHEDALIDLKEHLDIIDCMQNQVKRVLLFIDGLNIYKRSNDVLEEEVYKRLNEWKGSGKIQFCYSIGRMNPNQFPPFILDHNIQRLPGITSKTIDNTIVLKPVGVSSLEFQALLENMLEYYGVWTEGMRTKSKRSERESIRDKFATCCKRASGNHIEFRTVNFLLTSYSSYGDMIYKTPIGLLFYNFYLNSSKNDSLYETAKYVANFMLNKHDIEPLKTHYVVYKSDSIRDFFFAYYYVESFRIGAIQELKIFDCIFTPCINRFTVDLIIRDADIERSVVRNMIKCFDELSLKQKNQVVYFLGRVKTEDVKNKAIIFLKDLYSTERSCYEQSAGKRDNVMFLRTIGVSLLYLGSFGHENDFYHLVIYNKEMREVNRNFHIAYYTTESYKVGDDIELDSARACTSENIQVLYRFLHHSIVRADEQNTQTLNIITLCNLAIYNHYNNDVNSKKNINSVQLSKLLEKLKKDSSITNRVVKEFILNTSDYILSRNVYALTFEEIYHLKVTPRAGWTRPGREIDKKQQPESVADHSWACCLMAQILLTERMRDCDFMSEEECSQFESVYSKKHIISLLLVHDLSEAYTGDIPTDQKTKKNRDDEAKYINRISALDSFPFFHSFRDITNLWNEYEQKETYNARIANDIDKLEPLIQLYIYRKLLPPSSAQKVKESWMEDVDISLKTKFGREVYEFLVRFLLGIEFSK